MAEVTRKLHVETAADKRLEKQPPLKKQFMSIKLTTVYEEITLHIKATTHLNYDKYLLIFFNFRLQNSTRAGPTLN